MANDVVVKPRCFITSVGTSLIKNAGCAFQEIGIEPDADIDKFKALCANDRQFSEDKLDGYDTIVEIVIKNQKFSAEIDALRYYKHGLNANDRVILLSSMTDKAYFCACALSCYFSRFAKPRLSSVNIDIKIVEGLRAPEDQSFQEKGLPDFLDKIVDSIKEHEADYEIVLNPNGGYKSLFPYMTIAGIIYGIEVIYIYEKSHQPIQIPVLPLHVDLPAWTQMETLIEVLRERTDFDCNKMYQKFKGDFGPLLFESDGKLQVSALTNVFSAHARSERGKPELILRTQNSPLVNHILKPEHSAIFMRLAEIGHLIWKGDRVPEMADHALRHHSDLFHLAERVLLPIFYDDAAFLTSEELFILLCALYLHDCGHVIDQIRLKEDKSLPLFPVEIRDHHHVLGFLRLKYPEVNSYMGNLIYDQLCQTDAKDSDQHAKWHQGQTAFMDAVACIGLYHRKKMNLKLTNTYSFFSTNEAIPIEDRIHPDLLTRLKQEPVAVFGKALPFDRLALLTALLRIIDSLDEQTSRTGNINDIRFHLTQLEIDANSEREKANALGSALPESLREKLEHALQGLIASFTGQEDKESDEPRKSKIDPAEQFRQTLDALQKETNAHPNLIFQYTHSKLSAFFKEFQIKPYTEKAYIRGIDINASSDSSKKRVEVNLIMEDDTAKLGELQKSYPLSLHGQKLDMTADSDRNRFKKHMLNAISEEYNKTEESENGAKENVVKNILAKNGVVFRYGNL